MLEEQLSSTHLPNQLRAFLLNRSKDEIVSDEIYLQYPQLFANSYTTVEPKPIEFLNIAGYLYYKSVLLMDKLIDTNSIKNKAETLMIISKLQEESIKYLATVFKLESPFWKLWNKRQQEYFYAMQLEKQIAQNPSYKKYQQIADLKAAFGKVAIDCLHILSEEADKEKYTQLLQSHFHFSVGLQLLDDLYDLEEDLKNQQFNWAYHECITQLKKKEYDTDKMELSEIKKLIYVKGINTHIRKKALQEFKKSKALAQPYKAMSWISIVEKQETQIKLAIDQIEGYMQLTAAKIQLKNAAPVNDLLPSFTSDTPEKKALNYLLLEWQSGYSELKHLMYLSSLDGFSGKSCVHIGDIFQRAMVTNILMEAQSTLKINLQSIVEKEVGYLVQQRLKTKTGGWSYYPTCAEIAADADDLGEIMQVFISSQNEPLIKQYCQTPINILLKDRITEKDGIETWIIPKNKLTKKQQQQEYFNTTKWGVGPDNEVMANFLYGLARYDKAKYKTQILKSCEYLLNQQSSEGYWESRWYYGNYYGTYVCLRLFKEMGIENDKLSRAFNYIKKSQQQDGGWGTDNVSDVLNSAFAILTLRLLNKQIPKSAIDYLKGKQQSDGSWEAVSFIKPRSNDPYKSATLTTAFVLRALLNS